jgi:hypothetical protein
MSQMDAERSPRRQLRKNAVLLAVLLVLLAAWFGWCGVDQWRADAREQQLTAARDGLVASVSQALAAQTRTLAQRLEQEDVQSALSAGDAATAAIDSAIASPKLEKRRRMFTFLTFVFCRLPYNFNAPVESPNDERSVRPKPWATLNNAFAMGVPSAAFTCLLPARSPLAWPAKNSGQRLWLCMFESPIGEP